MRVGVNAITDLLDFVRKGALDPRAVDPHEALRSSVEEVGADQAELAPDPAPGLCSLDRDRIQQALTNVLRNAVQASPDRKVEASVEREGPALIFTIRDFGEGIPDGDEQPIFLPFHTTRVRGTGLGLAIARRIVERHGGTITAQNHAVRGAVFRISLPRHPKE